MNRYDRYPGDYLRDTLALTPAQDGMYGRLMDYYYTTEAPIPDADAESVTRCRNDEDRAITRWVLSRFFTLVDVGFDAWHHQRIEQEISKARPRIDAARNNGLRGGRPKNKPSGLADVNPEITQIESSPSPSPIEQKPRACPSGDGPPAKPKAVSKAERLGQVTAEAVAAYNAALAKPVGLLAGVRLTVGREKRQQQVGRCVRVMREICADRSGDPTITPDAWVDYFGACAADDFLRGAGPYSNGHTNWRPDFEYLTRPETVLKVYERAVTDAEADA